MIAILWNLASFIVALGILVAIHEYGHFWTARRCGVTVQRFSIGFGKVLWRKVGQDGTEYVIAAIPLGGYVKMLDERVDDVPEHLVDGAFNRKSVLARIAIVAAGPLANFVFAVFAFWLMYLIGVNGIKPIVGHVAPASIVAQAGIETGDEIISIDGEPAQHWQDVNLSLVGAFGQPSSDIVVRSNNNLTTKRLDLTQWKFEPEKHSPFRSLGLAPYFPEPSLVLSAVAEQSPAQQAGLRVGDKLVSVGGVKITKWKQFVEIIEQNGGTSVNVAYQRNDTMIEARITPQRKINNQGNSIGYAGVSPTPTPWPESSKVTLEYGVVDAFTKGMEKTWQLVSLSFNMIGKLVTGDLSVKNLSGPLSIAQGAGQSASYGVVAFLSFLALISVNLGIINLLPLPVLDGGHLMYYFVELVTGKPVPEKVQEVGFRIGAALLFMLMSIAIFNDFTRL